MNQDRKNQEVEFEPTSGTIITPESPRLVAERGAALREAQIRATISELDAQINQTEPTTELTTKQETDNQPPTPQVKLSSIKAATTGTGRIEDSSTWLKTLRTKLEGVTV